MKSLVGMLIICPFKSNTLSLCYSQSAEVFTGIQYHTQKAKRYLVNL